jgi:hypothetical protein
MHICEKWMSTWTGYRAAVHHLEKVTISEIDGILLIGIRKIRFTRTDQVIREYSTWPWPGDRCPAPPFLLLIGLDQAGFERADILQAEESAGENISSLQVSLDDGRREANARLDGLSMADGCLFKIVDDPGSQGSQTLRNSASTNWLNSSTSSEGK